MIELTESGVIQGSDGALVAMQRLRDLGVGLTIDDFGTGYSSLSRLAEFPIESLKIPKPFVDKLVGEDADEAFVDAILRLGDSLGLAAVAEGIEHPAQAERLRQMGCRFGQGYLFGRPAPAEEVERLLYQESPARPHASRSSRPRAPPERANSRRSPERGRPGRTKARDDRLDSRSGLTATTLRRSIEAAGFARRFGLSGDAQPPLPVSRIGARSGRGGQRRGRTKKHRYIADSRPGQAIGQATDLNGRSRSPWSWRSRCRSPCVR